MTASTPGDGAPRTRGARAWIAVGLLAAALATACSSGDIQATNPAAPTTSTAPDPSAPPTGVRWQDYQGIALPVGDQGPARNPGSGPVGGFTHDPQGAALAALQQTVRISVAPDYQWPSVVNAAVAPGPARDSFAVNRQLISIIAPPAADERPSIAGYRITDYTAERAVLTIYTTFPDDSIAASDTAVVWSGEDWRLLLPEPGDATVRVRSITEVPEEATPLEKS